MAARSHAELGNESLAGAGEIVTIQYDVGPRAVFVVSRGESSAGGCLLAGPLTPAPSPGGGGE